MPYTPYKTIDLTAAADVALVTAANGSLVSTDLTASAPNVWSISSHVLTDANPPATAGDNSSSMAVVPASIINGRLTANFGGNHCSIHGRVQTDPTTGTVTHAIGFVTYDNSLFRSVIGSGGGITNIGGITTGSLGGKKVRLTVTQQDSTTTGLKLEVLNSDGTVAETINTTDATASIQNLAGGFGIGAYDGNASTFTGQIITEEATGGGPIVPGTMTQPIITRTDTDGWLEWYQGAATNAADVLISGVSGGNSGTGYTFDYYIRPHGGGAWTQAATGQGSSYKYTGLTPNTQYDAYAQVTDSDSGTTPGNTTPITFWTAREAAYMLGDSTTYGYGTGSGGPATSWPLIAQNAINSAAGTSTTALRVLFVNGGRVGYTSSQLVALVATGSGGSAALRANFAAMLTARAISKIVWQAGANDCRDDIISDGSVSVGAATTIYAANLATLKGAIANRGGGLIGLLNYPFFIPDGADGTWTHTPDAYIQSFNGAIDTACNGSSGSSPFFRCATDSYSAYKTYQQAHGGDVHPPDAFHALYGGTLFPVDYAPGLAPQAPTSAPVVSISPTSTGLSVAIGTVSGATTYDLEVDDVVSTSVTSPVAETISNLATPHHYRARAVNAGGNGPWSAPVYLGGSGSGGTRRHGLRIGF